MGGNKAKPGCPSHVAGGTIGSLLTIAEGPVMTETESPPTHRSFRLTRGSSGGIEFPDVGSLREAFWVGVAQQLFLLVFSALLLDTGIVFRRVVVATIGFWCFVLIFLIRRRNSPTKGDLYFIKYGIWPLILIACVLAELIGRY